MRCGRLTKIVLCVAILLPTGSAQGAENLPEGARSFSLAGQLQVVLTADWAERRSELPPPDELVASTPPMNFSDILILENRKTNAFLKVAFSDNPFLGSDAPSLDAQMHAGGSRGLVQYLFCFFLPPPRTCLAQAEAALEEAKRQEGARLAAELQLLASGQVRMSIPRTVSVRAKCEFTSTPLDFYAAQVSAGISLKRAGRATGMLRNFYVPPMERVELAGRTFFVFEAQGQRYVERDELDKYNLPEELRGRVPSFFGQWALNLHSRSFATRCAKTSRSSILSMGA